MAINFNIEPFFDDYSEDKNFYRILFRPGYAVQARELTQLQTILQQQVKRHGDHIFKNGSMVIPGQVSYDTNTPYVKLKQLLPNSSTTTFSILSQVVGKIYEGQTSGVRAIVLTTTPVEVVGATTEPDTLYVKYIRGNTNEAVSSTGKFSSGEIISPVAGSTGLDLQVEESTIDANFIGTGTTASIERGVYYIKDNFVLVPQQTIVLAKYSNAPSVKCGLTVTESVVYPEDDASLLDNALGSPNYAAPGAARYTIDLELTSLPYSTTTDDEDFIPLLTLLNGNLQFIVDKTAYAELEKTLARRTFDESGDYTVNSFPIELRDYRNNDRGAWANNRTYLFGDIVTNSSTTYKCISEHTSPSSGSFSLGSPVRWIADTTPVYNRGLYQGPLVVSAEDTIEEIRALTNKVSVAIEPGKAYVRGYEIEKIATQYLTIDKARDLSTFETQSIDTSPGNYVLIQNVNALPDINETITFYDRYSASDGTAPSGGVVIATARAKQIQLNDTVFGVKRYKLFLFDLAITSGKDFAREAKYMYSVGTGSTAATRFSARIVPTLVQLPGSLSASSSSTTVTGVNTTFTSNLKQHDYVSIGGTAYQVTGVVSSNNSITIDTAISVTAGTLIYRVEAKINEPTRITSTYQLARDAVNTTQNLNYSFYKKTQVASTQSINEPGYVFGAATDSTNYIVVNRETGTHLTFVGTAIPSSEEFSIAGATTNTVTVTINSTSSAGFDFIYNLRKNTTGSASKQKTLTEITDTVTLTDGKATLTKSDGYELSKVLSGVTDITSKFIFDTGERNSHYDLARISLRPDQTQANGSITVTYTYFNPGVGGDYFSVNSHTHSTSGITYQEIPSERISSLDFRPIKNNDGTFTSVIIPKFGEETDAEYNYYLSRIDKLSLNKNGDFILSKGIPSIDPRTPRSPDESMDLYVFDMQPYTFSVSSSSIQVTKIENRRYTMRDIGKLENRINNLEYYTSLSLLEQNTANLKSYDQFGLERPQNGFIVDSFRDQGVGDSTSLDWKASVDMERGELRPFFNQAHVELFELLNANLSRPGANYVVMGDLAVLPYTTTSLVSQLRASRYESVNPFNVFTFNGTVEINPWSDTWFETARRPDVIITDDSRYKAVVAQAEAAGVLGTVWSSWETIWTGEEVIDSRERFQSRGSFRRANVFAVETVATTTTSISSGTRTFIRENVQNTVLSDKIVSTELVPYIRSRKILIRGEGLKPSTRIYGFFDGINVDSYITPSRRLRVTPYQSSTMPTFTVSANVGSNINSDSRKVTGSTGVTTAYTYGEVLIEKLFNGTTTTTTGVTCIVVGQETHEGNNYIYVDNIKGGSLGTSAGSNVYFLEGEFNSSNRVTIVSGGVTVFTDLRSTFTGKLFGTFDIPNTTLVSFRTGQRILRFTDSSTNDEANETTSALTKYEARGVLETYERTILSTKTASIVSENVGTRTQTVTNTGIRERFIGRRDPLAQTFVVSEENGVFITDVDLFFAAKDATVPVRIEIRNTVNGYPGSFILPYSEVIKRPDEVNINTTTGTTATKFTFKSPVYLQGGVEYSLVVLSDSEKYKVWIAQMGEYDAAGNGVIGVQPHLGVLFKSQNSSTWTADQNQDLKFVINKAVFNTGVTATLNVVNQNVETDIPYDLAQVNVNSLTFPDTSLSSEWINTTTSASTPIELGKTVKFSSTQTVKDRVEEAGTPSFKARMTFSSSNPDLSPVIDLSRMGATLVNNLIENTTAVTGDDEDVPTLGIAQAKYVSKRIRLNDPATNLRILFDANIPNEARIDVYYKVSVGSDENFNSTVYTLIDSASSDYVKTSQKTENENRFSETEIFIEELPAFDLLQVKIVLKSSNSAKVPRVKDLRIVAYA
jgi:hypothetical protein